MTTLDMSPLSEEDVLSLAMPMLYSDVADRLRVMQRQAATTYKCRDYIDDSDENCSAASYTSQGPQDPVDRECRVKMCEWCYQVTDFCKFRRETVAVCISYADRFLSTGRPRAHLATQNRKEYQLVILTTLYMAVKIFEPLEMNSTLLSAISRGCYTEMEIVDMEQEILEALSWMVNDPIAHDFLHYFMALLPPSTVENLDTVTTPLLNSSRYQVEIAVCDYEFALQNSSVVALAAILNSMEKIDEEKFPAKARFDFLRSIADTSGMNPFSSEINSARLRLLELFFEKSGYELPQLANLTPVTSTEEDCLSKLAGNVQLLSTSPVSVRRSI